MPSVAGNRKLRKKRKSCELEDDGADDSSRQKKTRSGLTVISVDTLPSSSSRLFQSLDQRPPVAGTSTLTREHASNMSDRKREQPASSSKLTGKPGKNRSLVTRNKSSNIKTISRQRQRQLTSRILQERLQGTLATNFSLLRRLRSDGSSIRSFSGNDDSILSEEKENSSQQLMVSSISSSSQEESSSSSSTSQLGSSSSSCSLSRTSQNRGEKCKSTNSDLDESSNCEDVNEDSIFSGEPSSDCLPRKRTKRSSKGGRSSKLAKRSVEARTDDVDESDKDLDTPEDLGADAYCTSSPESSPHRKNLKRSSNSRPNPRKKVRVVECGVRSDGTVCRCISDLISAEHNRNPTARRMQQGASPNFDRVVTERRRIDPIQESSQDSSSDDNIDSDADEIQEVESFEDEGTSDHESMYDTSYEDIDADLALNSPPSSRLHRCTAQCALGCRGNQRPSEIIIFESRCFNRLLKPGISVSQERPVCIDFNPTNFKRVGGRGVKRPSGGKNSPGASSNQNSGQVYPANIPQRSALVIDTPPVSYQEALKHAWNPQDRSFNIRLSENDPFTIRRQPVAQSTDSARTLIGYSSGVHAFQVIWPVKQRGTHAVVGVATDRQTLHSVGYSSLVGLTDQSWGWDLSRLKAFHNSTALEGTDYPAAKYPGFAVGKKFYMILDCDAGTLGFWQDDRWLGFAHSNLKGQTLYPIVSSVWGHCEISVRYHGGVEAGVPPRLMDLCRVKIRQSMKNLSGLPIPQSLKKFLIFGKQVK